MRKKNLFAIMMLASVLFAAFSCKNDEVEDPTLTLSEMSVQLPKAASEKSITVTTNQTEWTAIANADWIHLTQSGNTLTIKVEANPSTEKRMGEVAVLAVIGKKIEIEQEGSDVSIVVLPDKFNVNQFGGEYVFDIDANTNDWTVETDADWVQITAKQFKHEIVVNIGENKAREDRVAKLIFKAKNQALKEYVINQDGIIYHILPYMEFGPGVDPGDIEKFETARYSKLIGEPGLFSQHYTYETVSPAFDQVAYKITGGKKLYSEAIVFTKDRDFFTKDNGKEKLDYIAILKENGFEETGKDVFFNKEKRVEAKIIVAADYPHVLYKFIPEQPKAYPTFDKFPYGLIDFGKANDNDIVNWEAANGGTLNEEITNTVGNKTYDAPLPWLHRMYFMTKEEPFVLDQTLQLFDNLNLCFFDVNGELFLTNEFKKLLDREGFNLITQKGLEYYYYRKDIKLVLLVRPFQHKLFANGKRVLAFNIWKEDLGSTNLELKDISNKLRVE